MRDGEAQKGEFMYMEGCLVKVIDKCFAFTTKFNGLYNFMTDMIISMLQ